MTQVTAPTLKTHDKTLGMKAQDVMTQPVIAAGRNTTVRDAAIQMMFGGFSGMPVAERSGSLVGVVTEFDIIRGILAGKSAESTTVEEIMTPDVMSVEVDTPLADVMQLLEVARILRVPVTKGGKLVGVVSRPDVLRVIIEPNFMEFA